MLYKRPAEYEDTFRTKIEIAKNQPNQFFHIFLSTKLPANATLADGFFLGRLRSAFSSGVDH
jgi:hypothetical protein